MKEIKLNEVKNFEYFKEENLNFAKIFRNQHISISLDKYEVGAKHPMLYKDRPEGGKEILIPFKGKLKIITKTESKIFDPENEGLSLVVIDAREERQFENVGNTDAKVLAIFAPPFQLKEIEHFLKSLK
jgi:hypothetical protein